jgi:hypothetical protein
MLDKEIQKWLESEEFARFLKSGKQALILTASDGVGTRELQEKLKEMGRFYNHFIFQISESFLEQVQKQDPLKEKAQKEMVAKSLSLFLTELEKIAYKQFKDVFPFFLSYRNKIKNP